MDMVFSAARLVVLVDGCFWHGCPQHATTSRSNTEYWTEKIRANQARDRDTDTRLTAADRVEGLLRPRENDSSGDGTTT